LGQKARNKLAAVKSAVPQVKIFFLPQMSATRPMGSRKSAEEMRYEVATQLIIMASRENDSAMEGRAIMTADPMNGVRNEERDAMNRTEPLI